MSGGPGGAGGRRRGAGRGPPDDAARAGSTPPPSREGARCANHDALVAIARCPICDEDVCALCWQPTFGACHGCVVQAPRELAPPAAFEDPARSPVARLLGGLADAFRPVRSAPAMAVGGIGPAARFAALTALPFVLLHATVAYTFELRFGAALALRVTAPDAAALAVDLLRAFGIGLALFAAGMLTLALPYVSLLRAYGRPGAARAAVRLVLYRAWLLPAGAALFLATSWVAPEGARMVVGVVWIASRVGPLLLTLNAMRATARLAAGAGPFLSWLIVGVALAVQLVAEPLLTRVASPYLPADDPAASEQPAAPPAADAPTTTAPPAAEEPPAPI